MKRPAFTLLELLLVLCVIIMISAIGISGYQRQYARSQFKSGVVQIQVDVANARVLAMQSGNAYIFRYVPGSGIYEIAPLKTLQETLYRVHGDLGQSADSDALGGSFSFSDASAFPGVGGMNDPFSTGASSLYTDDLFSPENIAADMEEVAKENRRLARLGSTNVDMTGGLGGSLNSVPGSTPLGASAYSLNASTGYDLNMGGSSALSGSVGGSALGGFATSGSTLGGASLDGSAAFPNAGATGMYDATSDYSGVGAQFALGADMGVAGTGFDPMKYREMTGSEKALVDENTLMSRVNLEGVVVRKQIPGDAIFTFMRVSESTPSTLRARRPDGVKSSASDPVTGSEEGVDLGSALGGSLHSIPSASTGEGLGGGLNAIAGTDPNDPLNSSSSYEEDPLAMSMWSEPLIFFPNGKTSSAILGLANLGEYSFYSEIALRGMTGVTRISSISSTPPEFDPSRTALTQEQLFRLTNPGYASSGTNAIDPNAASGGALASTTPTGALGVDSNSTTAGLDSAGGLGAANAVGVDSMPTVNYGTAGGGYGSSDRRGGYQFATNPGASANAGTNSAPAGSNALNALSPGMNARGPASSAATGAQNNANDFGAIDAAIGNASANSNASTGSALGGADEKEDQDKNALGGGR